MRIAAFLTTLAFPFLALAGAAQYNVTVDGMTCDSCAKSVTSALSKIPGVDAKSVKVVLKKKTATFTVAEDKKEFTAEIKQAIEKAGYTVTDIKTASSTAPTAASKTN